MNQTKTKKIDLISILSSPKIFFYTCLWLFVLVLMGTIAQGDIGPYKGMGLYAAQKKYFSSWFIELANLRIFPAGRLAMAVVFVNLFFKFVYKSTWNVKRWGVNIAHVGSLVLLAGGFITAEGAYEGISLIPEGGRLNYFSDYHETELALSFKGSDSDKAQVVAISQQALKRKKPIKIEELGIEIQVQTYHENCVPERFAAETPKYYKGQSRHINLAAKTKDPNAESNLQGVEINISGGGEEADGFYVLYKDYEHPYALSRREYFKVGDKDVALCFRRRRYQLPFSVELKDVETVYYPGTTIPKSYSSKVNVIKDEEKSPRLIWMNHPLRKEGYTFFQSSVIGDNSEITGLAVVKNKGRMIPYISSIVICVGLMLHLAVCFPSMLAKKKSL